METTTEFVISRFACKTSNVDCQKALRIWLEVRIYKCI